MAIFQPTAVIPSSDTQGTVDINTNMEISWQVNGNSALTAFQIDFFENDYASTPVVSTGRRTDNCPFYGTDRFGKPQFFTWNAQNTWAQWSMLEPNPFTNGKSYKYKITQFYDGQTNVFSKTLSSPIGYPSQPYFSLPNGAFVYFYALDSSLSLANGTKIYYDLYNRQGWYIKGTQVVVLPFVYTLNEPNSDMSDNLGEMPSDTSYTQGVFVVQNSQNVFNTRGTPTLIIYRSNVSYQDEIAFPNNSSLKISIGFFKAKYEQGQGDPIRWIRWQVANVNNGVIGDILADTGDIYTPTLHYEFNGFFNGQQYAIRAICESENGLQTNSNPTNDGWIFFNIVIENQGDYTGKLTAQCVNKENVALLKWEGVEVIPPIVSPQGYEPAISNGSVTLLPKNSITGEEYSIMWNKKLIVNENGQNQEIPMNFASPWTAVWSGKIDMEYTNEHILINTSIILYDNFNKRYYGTQTYRSTKNPQNIVGLDVDIPSHDNITSSISYSGMDVTITLYSPKPIKSVRGSADVYYADLISPQGKVFSVNSNTTEMISMNTISSIPSLTLNVMNNIFEIPLRKDTQNMAVVISPLGYYIFYYSNGQLINEIKDSSLDYTQYPITSIVISGKSTINSVSVYNERYDIEKLYRNNVEFEPVWNSEDYKLYMTANFNGNLDGGTGTTTGNGFRIYRQEVGKNTLIPIATISSITTFLKDFGITSRKAYKYFLYSYDINGAFMNQVEADKVIATCFNSYSLLVCDYDSANDEYHVRKQYLFALNLSTGAVSNNNNPVLNKNFTPYPTRMGDVSNYRSGTLSGLIGVIYTVPALIEQIGNYKRTVKPSTMDYFDNVDLEKELYDLSVSPYLLFLRDMKGHLIMIDTNGAISMTTNIKQKQQSISISFPWVEVGDANDATIIQTPDDYGWNNDEQVIDVSLDVDVATGELSATYPFPYNGTKFYLTGINKENLTAKTPLGIIPAQFNLNNEATKPNDGEVTATVKVNLNTEN